MKKILFILPALMLLAAACNKPATVNNTSSIPASTTTATDNSAGQNNQAQGQSNSPGRSQTVTMVKVTLDPQNNSGQSGTATITEVQGKAKVILNLTGEPSKVAEPAHIHTGSCANLGGVKYPLTDVGNGASQTTLSVSLAQLLSEPFAINVHKSAQDINVYVACGDSLKMNKTMSNTTNTTPATSTTGQSNY